MRGDRRGGQRTAVTNAATGGATFDKPVDNIGVKTIPDYAAYAAKHVYTVNVPGCATPGRLFVGQRKEAFAVNLGVIFDLVNAPIGVITDPALIGAVPNTIDDANVTTLALELHKSCLVAGDEPSSAAGPRRACARRASSTPRRPRATRPPRRAAAPGSRSRASACRWSTRSSSASRTRTASTPASRATTRQFADYVTNPTLPRLLEIALNLPEHRADQLPAHRPGHDLPHRDQGAQPAQAA